MIMCKKIYFITVLMLMFLVYSCSKKTVSPEEKLTTPTNLVILQIDNESILLTWQDSNTSEEGFRIDRKIGENDWEENYQILPENSTTFLDTELISIDIYSYRISAFTEDEFSEFIEENIDFFYNDLSYIEGEPGQIIVTPMESANLIVYLNDINGNNVEKPFEVWFKFLSKPEGTNINNELFTTTDSISVQSTNGIAVVSLNAGTESGVASVEIYVFNTNNEVFSIVNS